MFHHLHLRRPRLDNTGRLAGYFSLVLVLVLCSTASRAQPLQVAKRIVLWITPSPADIAARVRGQISDLEVELIATPSTPARSHSGIERSARQKEAIAAMWAEKLDAGPYRLHVYHVAQHHWTQRDFDTGHTIQEDSAATEALAIGARSALRRIVNSSTTPNSPLSSTREVQATPPPSTGKRATAARRQRRSRHMMPPAQRPNTPPTRPTSQVPATALPVPPVPTASTRAPEGPPVTAEGIQWMVRVGWSATDTGPALFHGPSLELGIRLHIWSLHLGISSSLSRQIDLDEATLALRTDRMVALFRVLILQGRHLKLDLGLGVGVLRLHRRTVATGPQLGATSAKLSLSALVQAGFGLSVPLWTSGLSTLSAGLRLGLTSPLRPVTLRVDSPSTGARTARQTFQPFAALGLIALFP